MSFYVLLTQTGIIEYFEMFVIRRVLSECPSKLVGKNTIKKNESQVKTRKKSLIKMTASISISRRWPKRG
jgi:hypothetical protein